MTKFEMLILPIFSLIIWFIGLSIGIVLGVLAERRLKNGR